jgi:hypothetical protein
MQGEQPYRIEQHYWIEVFASWILVNSCDESVATKKVQLSRMEIDMVTPRAIDVRRRATILDKTTLLDKGICILDLNGFVWI